MKFLSHQKILTTTLLLLSFNFSTYANFDLAPPSFKYRGMKAIWVDFISAHHEIEYDNKKKKNIVKSTINFRSNRVGYPLFDLVPKAKAVILDGELVPVHSISVPEDISKINIIGSKIKPGNHTLEITHSIKERIQYKKRGVHSAYWIRDLRSRMFLEQYLPTNYEFDQYKITMDVKVNSKYSHNIFANGEVKELEKNHFHLSFPDYYTASSLYFHLIPKSRFWRLNFKYTSIDGRKIPVKVYSRWRLRNKRFMKKTRRIMRELEKDYGPYPHDSFLAYGVKLRGGMEYVAATTTSYRSLDHELLHMWFAKGAMPANGNSGWLDEAIASWRDYDYQTLTLPFYDSANLAAHSPFMRKTDGRSYKYGRSFLAHLNYVLKTNGKEDLRSYLKVFGKRKMHQLYTTEEFIEILQEISGMELREYFDQYVYGYNNVFVNQVVPYQLDEPSLREDKTDLNPHHSYSNQELDSIL